MIMKLLCTDVVITISLSVCCIVYAEQYGVTRMYKIIAAASVMASLLLAPLLIALIWSY